MRFRRSVVHPAGAGFSYRARRRFRLLMHRTFQEHRLACSRSRERSADSCPLSPPSRPAGPAHPHATLRRLPLRPTRLEDAVPLRHVHRGRPQPPRCESGAARRGAAPRSTWRPRAQKCRGTPRRELTQHRALPLPLDSTSFMQLQWAPKLPPMSASKGAANAKRYARLPPSRARPCNFQSTAGLRFARAISGAWGGASSAWPVPPLAPRLPFHHGPPAARAPSSPPPPFRPPAHHTMPPRQFAARQHARPVVPPGHTVPDGEEEAAARRRSAHGSRPAHL